MSLTISAPRSLATYNVRDIAYFICDTRQSTDSTYLHDNVELFNGKGDIFDRIAVLSEMIANVLIVRLVCGHEDETNLRTNDLIPLNHLNSTSFTFRRNWFSAEELILPYTSNEPLRNIPCSV